MALPGAQCTLYLSTQKVVVLLFLLLLVIMTQAQRLFINLLLLVTREGTDSLSYSPIKFYTAAAIMSREILRYSPRHRETSSVLCRDPYNSGKRGPRQRRNLQRLYNSGYGTAANDSTLQRRTAATTIRKREPTSSLARPSLPARPALLASNLRCQPGLRC